MLLSTTISDPVNKTLVRYRTYVDLRASTQFGLLLILPVAFHLRALAHEESCIPVQFVLVQAIMCCSFSVIQGARVEISTDRNQFGLSCNSLVNCKHLEKAISNGKIRYKTRMNTI
jgi:hypothetical protein